MRILSYEETAHPFKSFPLNNNSTKVLPKGKGGNSFIFESNSFNNFFNLILKMIVQI